MLLIMSGDIEANPGPQMPKRNGLSFAVWNIDSLLARGGCKIPLIEGLASSFQYDLLGLCETYLTSSVTPEQIEMNGFSPEPLRADAPSSSQHAHGGVCLFYKSHLAIKERKDLHQINETIVAEVALKRKKLYFVLSYRSPSQTSDEAANYFKGLESLIVNIFNEKPAVVILAGDFNARSPIFWENDAENSSGKRLCDIMTSNGMEELINEPTHFPRDEIETCIDLIFTDQPYLFTDYGVLPSLDSFCKHQIIYGKLSLTVPTPPPYTRLVWSYALADSSALKSSLLCIDWENILRGSSVDDMCTKFNDLFLATVSTFIPSKTIVCNDKDAPWITPRLKSLIKKCHKVYRKWAMRGRVLEHKAYVVNIRNKTNALIAKAKRSYHSTLARNLMDPNAGQKVFWAAFKRLVNKKKHTIIPPLLEHHTYITNFELKASLFNEYFAQQCTLLQNASTIPALTKRTSFLLSDIPITEEAVLKIISKLDPRKAHGHDGISVRMLQICACSIARPLTYIFRESLSSGKFPCSWKYANVQPVHKKGDRQLKSNYRPISLLPVCGKIFEKLIFNSLYSHLSSHQLLSESQSGFRPGDSSINQLLSITTDIYTAFETFDETRAVFLDISKAFDKVWHQGLLYKLKCNGIDGNLLQLLTDYLSNRRQRVVLQGLESHWMPIESGVPQGSVLGPLLFLVYINDLTDKIKSNIRLFADDSSLFASVSDIQTTQQLLSEDLHTIADWAYQWKMNFNPDASKQAIEVVFSVKRNPGVHPPLSFNGSPVSRLDSTKHLGLVLDSRLTFTKHIREAIIKAKKGIAILKFLSKFVTTNVIDLSYKLYVRPHLDYGDIIYHEQRRDLMNHLETVQYQAALVATGCWHGTNRDKLYEELGWESLAQRRWYRRLSYYYRIKNHLTPEYLARHIIDKPAHKYPLRSTRSTISPPVRTTRYQMSFFPFCSTAWEGLDPAIRSSPTLQGFQKSLLSFIRPIKRHYFGLNKKEGISLLTKLRVGFSDLREHRYRHNFNCEDPVCSCTLEPETTAHFFLRCPAYLNQRAILLSKLRSAINTGLPDQNDIMFTNILMYGSNVYDAATNRSILNATLIFIENSGRFRKNKST